MRLSVGLPLEDHWTKKERIFKIYNFVDFNFQIKQKRLLWKLSKLDYIIRKNTLLLYIIEITEKVEDKIS